MKFLIIFKKELLDQMRDKRTLIAAILLPAIIVPLLLFLTSQNTSQDEIITPVRVILQNPDSQIQSIILESFTNVQFITSNTPSAAIKSGKAELQIDVLKSGDKYIALTIYFDSARRISAMTNARIFKLLTSNFSTSAAPIDDLRITALPVRSEKENRTLVTLSLILPVFLMVFAASSTMASVIDMSSGEKERSTIETLISCNISSSAIIVGKILAASCIGFASVISLISGLVVCSFFYPQITGGVSLLGFSGFANIFLLGLLASLSIVLFSTAGMVIGLYARSVKEGTILTLPVIVLSSALASGLIAEDPFTVKTVYLLIPVVNFSYLIRSVLFSHYEIAAFIISVFANLSYAFLFFRLSKHLLEKETVICRS